MPECLPGTDDWPDSREFWRDKRVVVTGGSGFPGSFVVEKLKERGAAEIIGPRSSQYDLRDINAIRQLLHDVMGSSNVERANVQRKSRSTQVR